MTQHGFDGLQDELRRLKREDRPQIVREIKAAREHGDLSENAEYHAAKEKQGHIESRILQVEDMIARAEIVHTSGETPDRVRFGATVELEDLHTGESVRYTLVGEPEADISQGRLSIHSPVGRALIGKEVEDEVTVRVPSGTKQYEVRDIRYE
jgi:transcription elongation factor GreA